MVSLQAGIHINFVMGLNRLLKTHCIPWGVDLFCQLTRCQDGDMQPCKHKKNFIYRFHDNVYNLYSLWLNSKLIIVVLLFNRDFYLKDLWNIFSNILLNSKSLTVHQWENFSLIQNCSLCKKPNEGAFMRDIRQPVAPSGSSGTLWAVNQNKCGHLIGRRYRHTLAMRCTLNGNTVFGNIFTF